MQTGGLPGICFSRKDSNRVELWQNQVETLLSRDLDFIYPNRLPYAKRLQALKLVVERSGYPLEFADIARRAGCSQPTLSRLIGAFEGLFLIRRHGLNQPVFFCEDLGLSQYIYPYPKHDSKTPLLHFVFSELYSQMIYFHHHEVAFDSYRSRGGVDVPFIFTTKNQPNIAIVVDDSDGASDKSLKSLTWYSKKIPRMRVIKIVLHRGSKGYISSSGVPCIPIQWIS